MEHTIKVEKEDMIFNVLSIGEVKTGEEASATITGKEPNQFLNLTIPKGEKGDIGLTGNTGPKGNDGHTPLRGTDYWTASDKQEIINNVLSEVDIPTKTSDLTNDSGFITNAVNDLVNYYLKSESYNKTEVNSLVNNITKVTISVVDELPEVGESNIIYFVPKITKEKDIYDEYVWISNDWEHIGSTDVDLTGYATENWVNAQITNFLTEAQVNTLIINALTNYALKSEVPTKNSQLQNDSGFITGYTETDPTVPIHVKSITKEDITKWNDKSDFGGNYTDLKNKPSINNIELDGNKTLSDLNIDVPNLPDLIKNAKDFSESTVDISALDDGLYIGQDIDGTLAFSGISNKIIISKGSLLYIKTVSNKRYGVVLSLPYSIYGNPITENIIFNNFSGGWSITRFNLSKALSRDNIYSYTPTSDYNPAHKKYVDDTIKSKINATFTLDGTTLNINTEA